MPFNFEEEIALQGAMISRPESPALEGAAAEAIEEAFRKLIASLLVSKTHGGSGRSRRSGKKSDR
jgi:hypothetical protein